MIHIRKDIAKWRYFSHFSTRDKLVERNDPVTDIMLGIYGEKAWRAVDFMLHRCCDTMLVSYADTEPFMKSRCFVDSTGELFIRSNEKDPKADSDGLTLVDSLIGCRMLVFLGKSLEWIADSKRECYEMTELEKLTLEHADIICHILLNDVVGIGNSNVNEHNDILGSPFDPFITAKLELLYNDFAKAVPKKSKLHRYVDEIRSTIEAGWID